MAPGKLDKKFYNTILRQTFSPCGNFLIAGDIFGDISIFHLSKLINPETNLSRDEQKPKHSFTVKEDIQINSLLTTDDFLLVGVVGEIFAYSWKSIKSSKNIHCAWSLEIPIGKDIIDKAEVNCLYLISGTDTLYAACSEKILVFNIETRKLLHTLTGHSDYIHGLCGQDTSLISGGEDGQVCIRDIRQQKPVNTIEPYKNSKIARPELGKWIGEVGCNEDFLVCGGGPRLSLWHFRSLNYSTIFSIEDEGIHVAEIYKDKVLAGGRSEFFYQMNFNGEIITEIATSAVTTYSAVHQEEPFKALCIAGSSSKIDVCRNFVYKDLQLYCVSD